MEPTGVDAELLYGRSDTHFSQKVRNLVSHRALERRGFTQPRRFRNAPHRITPEGRDFLTANMEELARALRQSRDYEERKAKVATLTKIADVRLRAAMALRRRAAGLTTTSRS
jgi:hypothetical protein